MIRANRDCGCSTVKYGLMSDEAPNAEPMDDARIPLTPASFTFIVLSLRAQAEMQLGLMHFGEEQKPEPDLPMARHTIDLMAVLLEKTRGNLQLEEQRLLECRWLFDRGHPFPGA